MKLNIGDVITVKRIGNEARNRTEKELFLLAKVSKIGKKYFELEGFKRDRFFIESGFVDGKGYCQNYRVFENMEKALEDQRIAKAKYVISRFNFHVISDTDVDVIMGIIEKHETKQYIHNKR